MKKIINTAGSASGAPLSNAVQVGNMLFLSGAVGKDKSGKVPEGMYDQTKVVLDNLKSVLETAGSSMDKVVKCLVFVTDISKFQDMNRAYREYFKAGEFPARSTIEVKGLASPEYLVEIECVAYV